jgi:uncharacterized membrane protein
VASTFLFQRKEQTSRTPDTYERFLALASLILLIVAVIAVVKGHADWGRLPLALWGHLATIGLALALTPIMLLRRRGDRFHRTLGRLWVSAMLATAIISLDLRIVNRGSFSFIHVLSVWTILQVPLIIWFAHRHDIARHRASVRGMVTGALIIAGFFTFPFHRMLGQWLFS